MNSLLTAIISVVWAPKVVHIYSLCVEEMLSSVPVVSVFSNVTLIAATVKLHTYCQFITCCDYCVVYNPVYMSRFPGRLS